MLYSTGGRKKGGELVQLASPGISLETLLHLLSPSPGGMARRLGEESNFLSVLLAQWTGIDDSPTQVRIPSGAILRDDLEQRNSSYEQLNGELALAVDTSTALSVRQAASGPAQGEPSSEPLTKEGQRAMKGQPSIPGSNTLLVGSLISPWMVALTVPPAGETSEATSGLVDAVELLTAVQAVLQPQAAIQPQRTMQSRMQTIAGREDAHSLLGRGNGQAHMERRPLAMAYGRSQAAPDLPVIVWQKRPLTMTAQIGQPLTIPQWIQRDRPAVMANSQPVADSTVPVTVLTHPIMPEGEPLTSEAPQLRTSDPLRVENRQIGRLAMVKPRLLPSEGITVILWDKQRWPDQPVVSWSDSETEALATLSGEYRVPVRKTYDTVNDLEAELRVTAEMASQAPVTMAAGVEVRPPFQLSHPLWPRPPVVQWVSLGKSTELTGVLAAGPWPQRGPALSQTGGQSAKGESALIQLGKAPLVDLTQQGLYDGEAARWGAAPEVIEILVGQPPFPIRQAMAQSTTPAVIAQQPMPQVYLASQKAFAESQPTPPLGWESDKGEIALSPPLSRPAGGMKGHLVESNMQPFAQVPSADLTLSLPGSLSTQAASAIHDAAEETNPKHALSRVFDELIDRVYVALRRGESEWRLQLRPHSLGHLEVRLNADARSITLVMRVETPEAQALIQANLDQLKNGLTERGIQLERCDVVISRAEVEEMNLTGHFGGWEGMASRSYEILKPEPPRRATALQSQAEPVETAQSIVAGRMHSLIDLQV